MGERTRTHTHHWKFFRDQVSPALSRTSVNSSFVTRRDRGKFGSREKPLVRPTKIQLLAEKSREDPEVHRVSNPAKGPYIASQ